MFKRFLSTVLVAMLIFTFSFAGVSVSSVKKTTTTTKKTTTTSKAKTPPKTSTTKPKTPPKTPPKTTTVKPAPPKTSTAAPVKPQPKNVKQEIINTINSYLNTNSFSGYALVSMNDSIIYSKGFGKADFKKNINHSKETKYGIASITKQFTSLAIMQLEEKNALRVEDNINKYLPNFPYGDKITIHQLLNNTSGLPEHPLDFDITLYRPLNNKELNKANDDKVKLLFNPGESFLYSNTGYILLGYIIEKASGKPLEEYFKENIFDLLDMKNTGFNNEKNNLENMATGYLSSNKDEAEASWTDINVGYVRGSSGLFSTPEDLLKWETALTGGKLISKKSYDKMYSPNGYSYGYGWYINSYPANKPSYYHYGVSGVYRTYVYRRPIDKITIILISNFGDYEMGFIANMLESAVN